MNERMRPLHLPAVCALLVALAACGGGASTSDATRALPSVSSSPPRSAPAPGAPTTPAPVASASPTPSPAPSITTAASLFPSTSSRIGLFEVFDYAGGYMPQSTIDTLGKRVDAVWASVEPHAWKSVHPTMLISNYFIMGFDQYAALRHTLAWWQSHHPDWILYACKSNGTPTHDIAYMPGINVADMPFDIHNRDAVDYQIGAMADWARSQGYNALAIDQVVFWNTLLGGNPSFNQKVDRTEYGCGVWQGSTFVRRYKSPNDHAWTADVVNYVAQARSDLRSRNMTLIVNHPAGNTSDSDERALVQNAQVLLDETGFSDYGQYPEKPGLFEETLSYMRYAQSVGTAMLIADKFVSEAIVDDTGYEYSLATYMLGNEGNALLFVGGLHGYGTDTYRAEDDLAYGSPCAAYQTAGSVYWRRFSGSLAIVNSAGTAQTFTLPAGATYHDIEGRAVAPVLHLNPHDAYVLLHTPSGC
jgi:hypothetical protein